MMLMKSHNSDKLSNRIVHVSVQLFSNKDLALAMTEQLSLLHIMVSSLKNMMKDVLISSGLHHDSEQNKHKVNFWRKIKLDLVGNEINFLLFEMFFILFCVTIKFYRLLIVQSM